MFYKVVIPTAGIGSRISHYTKFFNKALVSVGDKPAIARVIEKFPEEIEIIIILGYKGDMIEDVLSIMFPKRVFKFLWVDKFEGNGSGLGYSLMAAKEELQCPFIFVPNDTVIGQDTIDLNPNIIGNWAAFYNNTELNKYNSEHFRCIELNEHKTNILSISGKGTRSNNIYCGIAGILDFKNFWAGMYSKTAVSAGEVEGLRNVEILKPIQIYDWFDCGTATYLKEAKKKFKNNNYNILEKENEAIWFIDEIVVKFSVNQKFISDRIKRLNYLPKDLLPKISKYGKYCYSYKKIDGQVISKILNPNIQKKLLDECYNKLWKKKIPISQEIKNHCYHFYYTKTVERLAYYLERFEQKDKNRYINGVYVNSVGNLLNRINWSSICDNPNWALFHGDLHNENILYTVQNGFKLLDWRQNFSGQSLDFGDTYYDLAKFKHGLLVNHEIVNKKMLRIHDLNFDEVQISIPQYSNLNECDEALSDWIKRKHFSLEKVNILTALIFINICGLHEYPYSRFLYLYGQHLLGKYINKIPIEQN